MKIRASVRKTRDNRRPIRRRTLAVRPADPKHKRRQQ
uniref:Ribosomal protein L36 n=1 Tax=Selaginella bisulcata TaxID=1715365 RepID=A0A482CGU4_9TRAC|nr:ribosomal protein L36 [Selaginella bisulcata]QBL75973.1 ribosomal protein L36 [Selaginella bisulcata]